MADTIDPEIAAAFAQHKQAAIDPDIAAAFAAHNSKPSVGDLRRREGQGEIAAGPTPDQAANAAHPAMSALAGLSPVSGLNGSPGETPEEHRQRMGAFATVARTVPPIAAGVMAGPGGYLATSAIMGTTMAAGEALGEAVERSAGTRKDFNAGAIAGAGAMGAVPVLKPAASITGALFKPAIQALNFQIAHTAGRLTGDWLAGDLKPSDILAAAGNDLLEGAKGTALTAALGYAIPGLGAAARTIADRPSIGNVGKTFAAEFQAPLVHEAAFRASENSKEMLQKFATTPESKALVDETAAALAQHVRIDPAAIPATLTTAIAKARTMPGDFVDNAVAAFSEAVGELATTEKAALRAGITHYVDAGSRITESQAQQKIQALVGTAPANAEAAIAQELVPGRTPGAAPNLPALAEEVKAANQLTLEKFKAAAEALYGPIKKRPEVTAPQVIKPAVSTGSPYGGSPAVTGPSIEKLLEARTRALKAIDFGAPVKAGDYSAFQHLDDIEKQLEDAYSRLPAGSTTKADLLAAAAFYKKGIAPYRAAYIDRVTRATGEAGGKGASLFSAVSGLEGPTRLKEAEIAAGSLWPDVKEAYAKAVYGDITSEGPRAAVDKISKSFSGSMGAGYQPDVLKTLFEITPASAALASKKLAEFDTLAAGFKTAQALTDRTTFNKLEGAFGDQHLDLLKKQIAPADWPLVQNAGGQVIQDKLQGGGTASDLVKGVLKAYRDPANATFSRQVVEEFMPGMTEAKAADMLAKIESDKTVFARNLRKDMADPKNRSFTNPTPDSILDYVAEAQHPNAGEELRKYLSAKSPELLGEVQSRLLDKTLRAAVPVGEGSVITGDAIRKAAKADAKSFEMVFGDLKPERLDMLAKTVDSAIAGATKDSLLSRMVMPIIGAVGKVVQGAANMVSVGSNAQVGALQGARVNKLLENGMLIKISQDPEIRAIMEKPFLDLTSRDKALLQARLPLMAQGLVRQK